MNFPSLPLSFHAFHCLHGCPNKGSLFLAQCNSDIYYYSHFNEFALYLHLFDLFANYFRSRSRAVVVEVSLAGKRDLPGQAAGTPTAAQQHRLSCPASGGTASTVTFSPCCAALGPRKQASTPSPETLKAPHLACEPGGAVCPLPQEGTATLSPEDSHRHSHGDASPRAHEGWTLAKPVPRSPSMSCIGGPTSHKEVGTSVTCRGI